MPPQMDVALMDRNVAYPKLGTSGFNADGARMCECPPPFAVGSF